jgi:hypothetical protein
MRDLIQGALDLMEKVRGDEQAKPNAPPRKRR